MNVLASAVVLAMSAAAGPAIAQNLDKLPKAVVAEIRAAENQCRAGEGEPGYEVANLVRSYYIGAGRSGP
jgi:hypothetical protein